MNTEVRGSVTQIKDKASSKNCIIYGVAYTAGINKRLTNKLDTNVYGGPRDPNYKYSPAVRLTEEQMSEEIFGKPLLYEHDPNKRIGTLISTVANKDGKLNIIAEIDSKYPLGEWAIAQVRGGVFTELSIGYDTRYNGDSTVEFVKDHKGQIIREISLVGNGFFPGCKVKVRASKNKVYKDFGKKQKGELKIVKVMASNVQQQQQNSVPPPSSTGDQQQQQQDLSSTNEQAEILKQFAEMKKQMQDLKAQKEQLENMNKVFLEEENKRRKKIAEENREKYEQSIKLTEEIMKEQGGQVSDTFKRALEEGSSSIDKEGQGFFNTVVGVTASLQNIKQQLDATRKENETLKQTLMIAKSMTNTDSRLEDNKEREDRRSNKVRNRQPVEPISQVMTVDPKQTPSNPPSWLNQFINRGSLRNNNNNSNSNGYYSDPNPHMYQQQKQGFQQPKSVSVNASMQKGGAFPTPVKKGYPVNKFSMRNNGTHSDVWGVLMQPGGNEGFSSMQHLAGENISQRH